MTDVSVIIPAKNAGATLGDQLDALGRQKTDRSWEILVIAETADKPTIKVAERHKEILHSLQLVTDHAAESAGEARNVGSQRAKGKYLLFCDADDVVEEAWLENLADGLEKYDAVGGPLEEKTLNSKESRILRRPMVTDHLHKAIGFPRAVSSNCGVRATVFSELRGFDPSYRYSEDTEFFIRLQVNGYSLGFIETAIVHYRHGDDLRASLKKIYRWNRTRPRLYGQYRKHGAIKQPKHGGRRWVVIILTSWRLLAGKERRLHWLSSAVRSYGRLIGSIRYRTFFL